MDSAISLITELGFPIAAALGLGAFVWKLINRIIEILGTSILILGLLLLVALISYSPSDPNFIFPENTEINKEGIKVNSAK